MNAPILTSDLLAGGPAEVDKNEQRILISPLAKRLAQDASINLRSIKGTGPHGRIIKSDI